VNEKVMSSSSAFGKKVLVTGASGFIGTHLCSRLHQMGAEVHGISRVVRAVEDRSVHWWRGDLSDISTVQTLMSALKPDVIFHLASHVAGAREVGRVLPTFASNLASTVNLLTAATELGCQRLVLAGSLEEPSADEVDAIPCSPYAAAKWASRAYARMFYELYRTPAVIARLFMVHGPGQQDLRKLVPYVILSLLRGDPPQLSNGQRPVDWIYVEDVVDGLVALALTAGVEGCTIDLGSGTLVPVRTVVEQIVQIIDTEVEPRFGAVAERPFEQIRVAETAQTYATLGWKPRTSLTTGLEHTVAWYRQQQEVGQRASR
jgi:nucleoside-diphosphate-sugar epimerase